MIVAILQARMSSTRLPGKVLKPLVGKPMIYRQVERIQRANRIDKLLIATSVEASDNPIADFCHQANIECFRGDLNNVLSRYYHGALSVNATTVVRLTADCPVIDPSVIDAIVSQHLSEHNDFTSNTKPSTLPDGLDVEIIQFSALEKAYNEATTDFDTEHVTPFITNHRELFTVGCYQSDVDLSHHRWTVDNPEDFELVENALKSRMISANQKFNGKTLLIYAVISDKAEMINLLVRYGANLNTPADDGLTPMEYAEKLNKIYAKAEIIVITA